MRKLMTSLFAVALLAGGGVALAATTGSDTVVAQVNSAPEPGDQLDEAPLRLHPFDLFGDVLDELVADGVITDAEAEQITDAFRARLGELRADLESRGGFGFHRHGHRFNHPGAHRFHANGLGDLLEDGVIDADELAELGEDHPFNDPEGPAAEYLDDGQLTGEELRELAGAVHERFHDRFPFGRWGAGDPNAEEGLFST